MAVKLQYENSTGQGKGPTVFSHLFNTLFVTCILCNLHSSHIASLSIYLLVHKHLTPHAPLLDQHGKQRDSAVAG